MAIQTWDSSDALLESIWSSVYAVCTYLLYNVGHNAHKISKKINLGKISKKIFQRRKGCEKYLLILAVGVGYHKTKYVHI